MRSELLNGISAVRRGAPSPLTVWRQSRRCHRGCRKWTLIKPWISWLLDIGLPSFRSVNNKFLLLISHPVWVTLLQQPKWTKTDFPVDLLSRRQMCGKLSCLQKWVTCCCFWCHTAPGRCYSAWLPHAASFANISHRAFTFSGSSEISLEMLQPECTAALVHLKAIFIYLGSTRIYLQKILCFFFLPK